MLKVRLDVQENETVKMVLKLKQIPEKKPITNQDIKDLIEKLKIPDLLDINLNLLDQSRVHPRYSKIVSRFIDANTPCYSGLAFIGDAFVNFVATIIIYNEYGLQSKNTNSIHPICTGGVLSELSTEFKSNRFLAQRAKDLDWDQFLAHNQREIRADTKKGDKAYADMIEGLIGCLYSSNGVEHIPEVCEVVKNILLPDSQITFLPTQSPVQYDFNDLIGVCLLGCGCGIIMMFIIFIMVLEYYQCY
jgi:dsRNA-specific ribonuclease